MTQFSRDFIVARTGVQSYIDQFLTELPNEAQSHILGGSIFLPLTPEHMVTAANVQWKGSDKEHRLFFEMYLLNRGFAFEGTSMQDTVRYQAPLQLAQSGFKSNHHCLNMPLISGSSIGMIPPMLQLVCLDSLPQKVLPSLQPRLKNFAEFLQDHGHINYFQNESSHVFKSVPLGPPREYFFLECDLSGSAKIFDMAGWFNAKDFMAFFRDQAASVAVNSFGGRQIASAGDMVRFAFPCCRTDVVERCALLKDKILPAAKQIATDYMAFKDNIAAQVVQDSAIKIAISRGFDYRMPYDHDGESYYILAGAKDTSVPRREAVILLDAELNEISHDQAIQNMLQPGRIARGGLFRRLNFF